MIEHSDSCSYQSCTCRTKPATEQEAADQLCLLLNLIEASGYEVQTKILKNQDYICVGQTLIAGPPCEDEPWEVLS